LANRDQVKEPYARSGGGGRGPDPEGETEERVKELPQIPGWPLLTGEEGQSVHQSAAQVSKEPYVLGDSGKAGAEERDNLEPSSEIASAVLAAEEACVVAFCESNQGNEVPPPVIETGHLEYAVPSARELKERLAELNPCQRRKLAQAYAEEYFGKEGVAEQFAQVAEGDEGILLAILSEFLTESARNKFCTELRQTNSS
jgi:hypothetical protein